MRKTTRRTLLRTAAAAATVAALPIRAYAQGEPIKIGVLTALTGAGGHDGPRMLKAIQSVFEEVNKAGGVLGRKLEIVLEDDQTNPEPAVRAARKLIEVNKVPIIIGTWASAVTSAVLPVCWESKTFLMTVSGADSISLLPHQGFLIRTQPTSKLQATAHGQFIHSLGAKRVGVIGIQAPFALANKEHLENTLKPLGGDVVSHVIYEKDKTTYRSEIDQMMRGRPDFIYTNGYAPDTVVLLRDMFRAGIDLPKFAQSYAVPQPTLDTIPPEVSARSIPASPRPISRARHTSWRPSVSASPSPTATKLRRPTGRTSPCSPSPRPRRRPASDSATTSARSARAPARRSTAPSRA
jgi:branched-chain amino acid transport system substrate-binding protein